LPGIVNKEGEGDVEMDGKDLRDLPGEKIVTSDHIGFSQIEVVRRKVVWNRGS
jgi:hypothetical protein